MRHWLQKISVSSSLPSFYYHPVLLFTSAPSCLPLPALFDLVNAFDWLKDGRKRETKERCNEFNGHSQQYDRLSWFRQCFHSNKQHRRTYKTISCWGTLFLTLSVPPSPFPPLTFFLYPLVSPLFLIFSFSFSFFFFLFSFLFSLFPLFRTTRSISK